MKSPKWKAPLSVAFLMSLFVTASASFAQQCPADLEDRIEFNPAYCAVFKGHCPSVEVQWCLNGSGEPAFISHFNGQWGEATEADGKVYQRTLVDPKVGQEGFWLKLWRGVEGEDPTFVDMTRLHRERSHGEAVTRNWFSMRAMPGGGCERDPNEQQICDESGNLELTGGPAIEPAVQWAMMGINPDAYDFEIQVTTRSGETHRINPVISQPDLDDPNVPFDDPYTLSLADIGALPGSEHPWSIDAVLASKLTGETLLYLGRVWIRVAANGDLEASDPRCVVTEPEICTVQVDEIVAHNFYEYGPEMLELRRADGSVVWSVDVPAEPVPTSQWPGPEVLLSYPDYQRPEELTLVSRASGCDGTDIDGCIDTSGPHLYERKLDRLTAWTDDFQATLTVAENPCQPVERTCGGGSEYRCEPTLTVRAKMDEDPWQLSLVKVNSLGAYEIACINVPGSLDETAVYEQEIALGCSNSPALDDDAKHFELVRGCEPPSQGFSGKVSQVEPLDELELRSHHRFEEPNEYLVCSETGQSLDPESDGSLGVIINELQLPALDANGLCDPDDVNYQRAVAVAEQLPAGTRYVRRTIRWPDVQPESDSQLDFRPYQCLLEPFFAEGYEAFLTLSRTPHWACADQTSGTSCQEGDAPDLVEWEQFVVATLEAFGGNEGPVREFEIWQEPENNEFSNLSVDHYREMLKRAYNNRCLDEGQGAPVCHRIWAPNSIFSSFKRADKIESFLRAVLAPDEETDQRFLDGVAIHSFFKIDDVSSGIAGSVEYTRRLMDSIVNIEEQPIYEGVPIAVTAVSVASVPKTVEGCLMDEITPEERTAYLEDTFVCGLTAGAESVIWFSSTDERFWQCGVDPETGLDRATGAGILKPVVDDDFNPATTDLTKPEMAAPFNQIGCSLNPNLSGCGAP